jgi:hypothetical protein
MRTTMIERCRPVLEAWAAHCEGKGAGSAKVIPLANGKRK